MSKGDSGGTGIRGGQSPVRTASGVKWVKSPADVAAGHVAVQVDVGKLDRAWKKDPTHHVPPGGRTGEGEKEKYDRARAFVSDRKRKTPVRMPSVRYTRNGKAQFIDGRHRTAAVRDKGGKKIWVAVPRSQVARVKRDLS